MTTFNLNPDTGTFHVHVKPINAKEVLFDVERTHGSNSDPVICCSNIKPEDAIDIGKALIDAGYEAKREKGAQKEETPKLDPLKIEIIVNGQKVDPITEILEWWNNNGIVSSRN